MRFRFCFGTNRLRLTSEGQIQVRFLVLFWDKGNVMGHAVVVFLEYYCSLLPVHDMK